MTFYIVCLFMSDFLQRLNWNGFNLNPFFIKPINGSVSYEGLNCLYMCVCVRVRAHVCVCTHIYQFKKIIMPYWTLVSISFVHDALNMDVKHLSERLLLFTLVYIVTVTYDYHILVSWGLLHCFPILSAPGSLFLLHLWQHFVSFFVLRDPEAVFRGLGR